MAEPAQGESKRNVILVTGATGNVGKHVAKKLISRQGQPGNGDYMVRLAMSNPDKADKSQYGVGEGDAEGKVEFVKFDFVNPSTFPAALKEYVPCVRCVSGLIDVPCEINRAYFAAAESAISCVSPAATA